jgi:K+ transporter
LEGWPFEVRVHIAHQPAILAALNPLHACDALLIAGCAVKFFDGGWFPLALGLLLFGVMSTWSRGLGPLKERHPGSGA